MTHCQRVGRWLCCAMLLAAGLVGCQQQMVTVPDYARPLPPGASALRKITDPSQMPDFTQAIQRRGPGLTTALDRSLAWFATPSSRQFFPLDHITHAQAMASVFALRSIVNDTNDTQSIAQELADNFDVYTSVGYDDRGTVLFTAYYTPELPASRVRTGQYQYPLYRRPADLVSDPVTGQVLGRRVGNKIVPYPTRAQIEYYHLLAGHELVWLADRLDAYLVEVQGSAKLDMTDGSTMYVGFAGTNGYPYKSLGRMLVADGKLNPNTLSLPAVRAYFHAHPDELNGYIRRNDRMIFFKPYDGKSWPAGSLGVPVTSLRTLATDKSIFPRGCPTLVMLSMPAAAGTQPFDQFMVDQDTGGSIRAAGRADLYMGQGEAAGEAAGRVKSEGRLYYLLLKPDKVAGWLVKMPHS